MLNGEEVLGRWLWFGSRTVHSNQSLSVENAFCEFLKTVQLWCTYIERSNFCVPLMCSSYLSLVVLGKVRENTQRAFKIKQWNCHDAIRPTAVTVEIWAQHIRLVPNAPTAKSQADVFHKCPTLKTFTISSELLIGVRALKLFSKQKHMWTYREEMDSWTWLAPACKCVHWVTCLGSRRQSSLWFPSFLTSHRCYRDGRGPAGFATPSCWAIWFALFFVVSLSKG